MVTRKMTFDTIFRSRAEELKEFLDNNCIKSEVTKRPECYHFEIVCDEDEKAQIEDFLYERSAVSQDATESTEKPQKRFYRRIHIFLYLEQKRLHRAITRVLKWIREK